jgi:peptidyl-prolyl cis-trans isomerase A (cyclophilin A)
MASMPRMIRPAALALAALLVPLAALAEEEKAPPPASTSPAPAAKKPEKAPAKAAPKELYATFVTTEGKKEWTDPRTGQRSRKPLYDGTIFHRVIPGFMIQGGDPLGVGVGGPGYAIPDELDEKERFFDQPCQLAYANSGPNSNGSQFFITEVPTLHLNPEKCTRSPSGLCGYVRFGEGVCGCDLVGKIARLGNGKTTLEKVVISKTKPTCN